ncbi:hypothetical protein [Parasitella parasitica]|uniref:OTU domain-containing protein n=1 Tax=Parasitella parasitica TaxID=35722 RepID=A0A0B7N8N5_9FUNG|nr:hypothetical protein [Parasitella parasitica]
MVKRKETKVKREKLARKQRRAMDKNFFGDPENLDAQLKNLGLCTKNIAGDGNCLFRSLSDQYHGHDGNHRAVRQEICQYLGANEEIYKFFVEDDQSFEHHVECMSQDATFGGNMELAAFAKLKKVDIKNSYVINGHEDENEQEKEEGEEEQRQTLHIAYHSWEHYSSVRNIHGPYSGPPEVKMEENFVNKTTKDKSYVIIDEKDELNSKEKVVRSAHPDASIRKIRRLLIKYKGDPDKVVDAIYDLELKHVKNEIKNNKIPDYEIIETVFNSTATKSPQITQQDVVSTEIVNENKGNVEIDGSETKIVEIEETQDNRVSVEKEKDGFCQQQATTELSKPKKLSAAERKKEQKKRQKENKLMKGRAKAARKAGYKLSKPQEDDEAQVDSAKNVVKFTKAMKELYI